MIYTCLKAPVVPAVLVLTRHGNQAGAPARERPFEPHCT